MLNDFMRGRYGADALTYVLLFFSIIFANMKYVWLLGLIIGGLAIFRILSKDIARRKSELDAFNKLTARLQPYLMRMARYLASLLVSLQKSLSRYMMMFQQRKTHTFINCPKCRNMLRLPKNKGKLKVTCPVCKHEFLRKT